MIKSIDQIYPLYLECSSISIDSRSIEEDCMFVALKGTRFNANEFAQMAIENGARYALVDHENYLSDPRIILVEDTLTTLQDLARYHRSQLKIPVIGITGSNGKTTTKELISKVLETTFKVTATKGNLNNHIGVPLTILSIQFDIEIAIVEMGANHIGEIAELCEITQPTHGMITNIGRAHTEGFGGFEGVIRGKSELYQYLIQNGGEVFINSSDEILSNMAKRFSRPIFYPAEGDFLHITYTKSDPYLSFIGERNLEIKTRLIGSYNFNNVAAALCIAKTFKVPVELAELAIADYEPNNNRSQVIQKGTNTIILDAYNANPSSMIAALENLLSMNATKKVVILGDMMELGTESSLAHDEIVSLTKDGLSEVLLCGQKMAGARSMNPDARHFNSIGDLVKFIDENPLTDSTILIKASRSMELEKIAEYI